MSWISKELPSNYDAQPTHGLSFLDGNVLAELYKQPYAKDKKFPVVVLASSSFRAINHPKDQPPQIRILDQFQAPLQITHAELIKYIVEHDDDRDVNPSQFEIYVQPIDKARLVLWQIETGGSYLITVDNQNRIIQDIQYRPQIPSIPETMLAPRPMELLDEISRLALPPLYTTENQGDKAIAPVKFFTPDSGWTWYPTEFDGENIFFGLVCGLDVELGYFSLPELLQGRGQLGLPIERDLYYEPKSIGEIRLLHKW